MAQGLGILSSSVCDQTSTDDGDELTHICCCKDKDIALCGSDLTGVPYGSMPDDILCNVCFELEEWSIEGEVEMCPRTDQPCPIGSAS